MSAQRFVGLKSTAAPATRHSSKCVSFFPHAEELGVRVATMSVPQQREHGGVSRQIRRPKSANNRSVCIHRKVSERKPFGI